MSIPNVDVEKLPEYDDHHKVIFLNNPDAGLKGFIAIHRKSKDIPSFGATRLWRYQDEREALSDALRLSRLMSYKAALAGLPCGGAKGTILAPAHLKKEDRAKILLAYAKEVNTLRGTFITGTDVGVSEDDLALMKSVSEFFVGMNGDATEHTALGIYTGMETCFEFLDGASDLTGKTVAIQGLGKVGEALLERVYPKAKKVYAADINTAIVERVQERFPRVSIIAPPEIHKQKIDIYSPCALSNSLNKKNVAELKCRIIAGGANNQLKNEAAGDALFESGVLYAPDYVVNAGGLISIYDEYEHPGRYDQARVKKKVLATRDTLRRILSESASRKISTNRIANEIAEQCFNGY